MRLVEGTGSKSTGDIDIAGTWKGNSTWDDERRLVTVNFAPNHSQCYARLLFGDLGNGRWRLEDLTGDARPCRCGPVLGPRGAGVPLLPDRPPFDRPGADDLDVDRSVICSPFDRNDSFAGRFKLTSGSL